MMGMLRAEMLKYKRTFMAKLVIFIPLFFAVYSLVTSYLVPGSYDWNGILVISFNWWPVTFLPLGYGLFAGMVAEHLRKARAKIKKAGAEDPVATVWGIGYRWQKKEGRDEMAHA